MPDDPTGTAITPGDGSWCKIVGVASPAEDTDEAVITVATAVKNKILAGAPSLSDSIHQKAKDLLLGIHNKGVAALFGFKTTAVSQAPFRLVKRISKSSKPAASSSVKSFIALSYCWHNKDWSKEGGSGNSTRNTNIPISPFLFEALLEERVSDDEGVWIDQLCINQTDENEKAMAIGAMDVIYQRARLVAVVLEDIAIDKDEEQALRSIVEAFQQGGKWNYREKLEASRRLTKLTWKIFSARWFTRAWCGHELLVSNHQLFFIRCDTYDGHSPVVVKMTASFLFDLSILAKAVSSHIATDEFALLENTYGSQLSRFYIYATQKFNPRWAITNSKGVEDPSFTQSYMLVFRRVFGFDASVTSDKLSIALNVLQCGLFLKGSSLKTKEQCCYAFYHIALAARDPTSLSTCGERLKPAAWMRWPRAMDIMEPYPTRSRHLRLERIPTFDDKGIDLELVFLGSSLTNMYRATPAHIAWADRVLQRCVDYADDVPDQGFEFFEQVARAPRDVENPRRQFYAQLIACVRACGIEWLVQIWRAKDPALFDEDTEKGIRRVMSMNYEREKELESSERSDLIYVHYFIDGLVGAWLPEEPGASWKPAWIQIDDGVTGKLLFLCPEGGEYSITIPTMLLRAEFGFLRRLWFLVSEPLDSVGNRCWTVIGKSCSFGELDLQRLQKTQSVIGPQKICG
ncbi:hypothetical protein PT974_10397 [Cladobotryum mycophilum]|uniref:Heterokaryon incompatibility domain-containing protein n=1 Tax=Cladobotryum mycophilum TaxID=491253 RepID=A0ABR0S9R0_9HYPO